MSLYVIEDTVKKVSESSYIIGQNLPPRHWYQKAVGWFGKSVIALSVLGLGAYFVAVPMVHDRANNTLASRASDLANTPTRLNPIADKPPENIVNLQTVLDEWQVTHKNERWAVVAKSMSGPIFDARLNSKQQFESASIYKLFLTLPLYEKLPLDKQKTTDLYVAGKTESVAECVDVMLRLSNNECGEALGAYVGWNNINKSLKSNKFNNTNFGNNSIKTSALDTANFLERLSESDMLPNSDRDFILSALAKQKWRDGIPAGCPGCKVANKTGQLNDINHDAGIIRYNGGSYILVIFSEHGSSKEIAELTGKIQQKILDTSNIK